MKCAVARKLSLCFSDQKIIEPGENQVMLDDRKIREKLISEGVICVMHEYVSLLVLGMLGV